jgi:hypothetical protein
MSNLSTAARALLPESDFLDPALKVGVVLDQEDVDRAAAILGKFRDPAAARARLLALAARKSLRLPAGLAAGAAAGFAAGYSPQELAAMPSTTFADPVNRRWPIYTQADLDRCLRECPNPHEPPIQGQLIRLAGVRNLKLPADFAAGASARFDQAAAHQANFAHSDAPARGWDAAAGAAAGELAAAVNARKRKAALPPEPVPPRQPARPQAPAQGSAEFGQDAEAAELAACRRRAIEFAAAANRRTRRQPLPGPSA